MSADPLLDETIDPAGLAAEEDAHEGGRPDDRVDDERHDEENRLKPEYLRAVRTALEEDRRRSTRPTSPTCSNCSTMTSAPS